jgi:hypothetical protein
MSMRWDRRGPDSLQSGEYIISRARVQGEWIYTLWCGRDRISDHGTAEQAKRAAEAMNG